MDVLADHYGQYDEDERLIKDKAHRVEFSTTLRVLEKYVEPGYELLEIGAATGRYSLHYGEKGASVTAVDIVDKHVEMLRARVKDRGLQHSMKVFKGDGRDLGFIEDETFDVVLCLGPLYHLAEYEDKKRCMSEALRVLKKGGILAAAYINKCAVFLDEVMRHIEEVDECLMTDIMTTGHVDEGVFCFMTPQEMRDVMRSFPVEELSMTGTDGVSAIIRDKINAMDDEKYNLWLKYHFDHCDEQSILGYSLHGLYVCRKLPETV